MEFKLRCYVFNPHIFYTSNDDSQSVLRAKKVRSDSFVISSGRYAACQIAFRLPIIHNIEDIIAYCDISGWMYWV